MSEINNEEHLFNVLNLDSNPFPCFTENMDKLDQCLSVSTQNIPSSLSSQVSVTPSQMAQQQELQCQEHLDLQSKEEVPSLDSSNILLNKDDQFQIEKFQIPKGQEKIQEEESQNDEEMDFSDDEDNKEDSNQSNGNDTQNVGPSKKQKRKALISHNSKNRNGPKNQSKCQRIRTIIKKSHPTKNIPPELLRKIKFCIDNRKLDEETIRKVKGNKDMMILLKKKRLNSVELTQFILESGFSQLDWKRVLNFKQIQEHIEKSNKIGTSKHYVGEYEKYQKFLIQMDKRLQKIIYRSIYRLVIRILNGQKFDKYLDKQADLQLLQLDKDYENSQTQRSDFRNLCLLVKDKKINIKKPKKSLLSSQ